MRRHLREFLTNELFCGQQLPPEYNHRFFPTLKDLRNHIYRAIVQLRFSKCDQTNVAAKVKEWQSQHPDDYFFFRPYSDKMPEDEIVPLNLENESDDEAVQVTSPASKQALLFVHQTAWQRRLLSRYGNICLLDATYHTTRYSLPLFFIAVKTNVDYQIVASFVIQHKTADAIKKALKILKGWNPDWKPNYFMTDLSGPEIQTSFQVKIIIQSNECLFHVFSRPH